MEYYYKESEIMSLAGEWMELKTVIISQINKLKKANIACSHSFMEHRFKMVVVMTMTTMMEQECEGDVRGWR
jgi:hypothetical protein